MEKLQPDNPDEELNQTPQGDSVEDVRRNNQEDEEQQKILGELPCLDSSSTCIQQLNQKAVESNLSLRQMQERIEEINTKISEAQANGKKSVALEVFKPIAQFYLKDEVIPSTVPGQQPTTKRPLTRLLNIFTSPVNAFNDILGLIGVPLFEQRFGGSQQAQTRAIAIGDLQIKVAELQRGRTELSGKLTDKVTEEVFKYEELKRRADLKSAIAVREANRIKLIEVGYRLGDSDTNAMLAAYNNVDDRKADAIEAKSLLKIQLQRVKVLVLGSGLAEE